MDKNSRIKSIDALRGFDMLFIMGLSSLIISVCKLWPDSGVAQWLSLQMTHAPWHGLRHHDTIFPLFLFLAGMTFPFSLSAQREHGRSTAQIVLKIVRRGLVLVLLGLVYEGLLQFDFANQRVASVLGRIGLAWMFAALLYMSLKPRTTGCIAVLLLVGYWLLLWLAPGGGDPFSYEGNIVGVVDRKLLPGSLCYGDVDPEGILSTIPSVVTALLGMLTGELVRLPAEKMSGGRKTLVMLGAAAVLIAVGCIWNKVFPINKNLWTSSFVCVVGGYSIALYALFYWIIDVRGLNRWAFPLRVIGLNSITVYMAQSIIGFRDIEEFFLGGVLGLLPEAWSGIAGNLGYIVVVWLFLYFLYRKNVFLKV